LIVIDGNDGSAGVVMKSHNIGVYYKKNETKIRLRILL